ncbi:hypothetical protein ACA910_002198 [Epithemia clementina (nom. ined.)]
MKKQEDICHQLPDLIRSHVQDYIHCHVNGNVSQWYCHAWTRAPHVVLTESDPLQFVRYCHYNLSAGAQRLCRYWKERVSLFGPERALLPLTLTGTGALTPEEVQALFLVGVGGGGGDCTTTSNDITWDGGGDGGAVMRLLPETRIGQQCILFDNHRCCFGTTTTTRNDGGGGGGLQHSTTTTNTTTAATTPSIELQLKCLFYLFQLLAQDDRSQMDSGDSGNGGNGVLCLVRLVTPNQYDLDWNLFHQLFSVIQSALPVKIQVHLIHLPDPKRWALAAGVMTAAETMFRRLLVLQSQPSLGGGEEEKEATTGHGSDTATSNNDHKRNHHHHQNGTTAAATSAAVASSSFATSTSTPSVWVSSSSSSSPLPASPGPAAVLYVHVEREAGRVVQTLVTHWYMTQETIPTCLGGQWNEVKEFQTWCRQRRAIEIQQEQQQSRGGDVLLQNAGARTTTGADAALMMMMRPPVPPQDSLVAGGGFGETPYPMVVAPTRVLAGSAAAAVTSSLPCAGSFIPPSSHRTCAIPAMRTPSSSSSLFSFSSLLPTTNQHAASLARPKPALPQHPPPACRALSNVAPASTHNSSPGLLSPLSDDPNDICSQLPDLVRSLVVDIIQAGNSTTLPKQDTLAFLEAMAVDSRMVLLEESDPIQFVRFCQYNLQAAAKRLCLYWTTRKRVFGPNRAFLPLTLTGTGALTPADVQTLQAGFPALLPDATTTGQKCLLVDRRKWIPSATTDNKLRAYFYLAHIVAQDYRSQLYGVLLCSVKVTPRDKNVDFECMQRITAIAATVMPIHHIFHLVCVPPKKKHADAAELVTALAQNLGQVFQSRVYVHFETEPGQILQELLAIGMSPKAIPLSFGGEWKIEDWFDWCRKRRELESQKYKDRLLKEAPDSLDAVGTARNVPVALANKSADDENKDGVPKDKDEEENDDDSDQKVSKKPRGRSSCRVLSLNKPEEVEEERSSKRKMADLLYSRRKRERQRIRVQTLKEDAARLSQQNQALRNEETRLLALLQQAKKEECWSNGANA